MIEVNSASKQVVIKRQFEYLRASESKNSLRVGYYEITEIDGVETKRELIEYPRDYAFWKASELGVAIMDMINLDLAQQDPSAPRN